MAAGGSGYISGNPASHIYVNTLVSYFGVVRIGAAGIGNLTINTNTTFRLGTDMNIYSSLKLQSGKIFADGHNISILNNASLTAGSATSYIVTNTGGKLIQTIAASGSMFYPVGTENTYSPITIENNVPGNTSTIGVGTAASVLQQGTTGFDMSSTESVVKTTWFIDASGQSIDLNIEPQWPASLEVNGFNSAACFLSYFENGGWSTQPHATATTIGSMKGLKRSNINGSGAYAVMDTSAALFIGDKRYSTESLSLYPNPATNNINLKSTGTGTANMAIYDVAGRMVKTFSITHGVTPIDISELNSGVYFIRGTDAGSNTVARFVKK
jgi:hypothetical protein